MTRSEMFDAARAAGHDAPALHETARGLFYVTCSCGYRSTNRRTVRLALEAGVHHAIKEGKNAVASGVSLPGFVSVGA
jgi:hypothetical protein